MLRLMPPMVAPDLLVGGQAMDDAAVYRLRDDLAIAFTTDVFTPIVDDAYSFGAIAAANALSDLYAMGATPFLALNIAGWPRGTLPLDLLADVQRGAADKVLEAGGVIGGGHSIDDPEPKFGLAVLGTLDPEAVSTNAGARPDDLLVLTKPLGTGIITTAGKFDAASQTALEAAIESMTTLNADAARAASDHGAHAVTDVTGYGLLGHLREMLNASGVSAEVYVDEVPALPEVWSLIAADEVPGGTERNLASLEGDVHWHPAVEMSERILLADAQTSGGLLIAIPPEDEAALRYALERAGTPAAATVGRVTSQDSWLMYVRPADSVDDSDD